MPLCHYAIMPFCHPAILLSCHFAILLYWLYIAILIFFHRHHHHHVVLSFCHHVILASWHSVILSSCHSFNLSSWYFVIPSYYFVKQFGFGQFTSLGLFTRRTTCLEASIVGLSWGLSYCFVILLSGYFVLLTAYHLINFPGWHLWLSL